jgi:hypothetical protein
LDQDDDGGCGEKWSVMDVFQRQSQQVDRCGVGGRRCEGCLHRVGLASREMVLSLTEVENEGEGGRKTMRSWLCIGYLMYFLDMQGEILSRQ